MLRDFPLEADRHLLLMRTSQLLILTSSCAVVIMHVATRCRLPTIHVNMGYNKLLSQSAETITDEIKEEKQTPERKRETRGERRPAFINTEKIQFPSWTHITLCTARLQHVYLKGSRGRRTRERQPHPGRRVKYNGSEQPDRARRGHEAPERFRKLWDLQPLSCHPQCSSLPAQKVSQFGFYRWNKLYWAATCTIKHWRISMISAVFLQNHFKSLLSYMRSSSPVSIIKSPRKLQLLFRICSPAIQSW